MKSGISLLCLGLFLAVRIPLAFANTLASFEKDVFGAPLPLGLTDWLILIGIGIGVGGAPIFFGLRRILKTRHGGAVIGETPIAGENEGLRQRAIAFQEENCTGCRFADEEALQRGKPWCTRQEPPEYNERYCYSREHKETPKYPSV